jgi:hypothetical protein
MAKKGVTPNRVYQTKHGPECSKCGGKLYPSHRWKKLPIDQRKELRKEGWRRAAAHGMCQACYGKAWFNGDERINSNIKRRDDGVADVEYLRTNPDGLVKKLTKAQVAFLRAEIGWQPDWSDDHWPELDEAADVLDVPGSMLASMLDTLNSIMDGREFSSRPKAKETA